MFKQIAIAFDQLFNTFVWYHGMGWADETLSARAWRMAQTDPGWERIRFCIDALFFWQAAHCYGGYISELQRRQLPAEYRKPQGAPPCLHEK